ncbi:MAG TPA: hypothetical protein VGO75_08850 [Gemmatimonadaceae bacterium]|nr:hypothetical protein [Gemmatimonadaceae bacterium]
MRRLAIALCAAQFSLSGATTMSGQDSTYDENALRVETHLGDLQVVRGTKGIVVASAGLIHGPKVADLVSSSDRALAEARAFERDYDPGQYIVGIGIATLGAAVGTFRIPDINPAIPSGLLAASVLMIGYGGSKLESAYKALSRAIWWYNRDLKR